MKIFVVGAGLMGGGIAQVCAQAGYEVKIRDLRDELIENRLKTIRWSVSKLLEKGRIQGTTNDIMRRIHGVTDLSAAEDADFVFEAITESLDAKRSLFSELDKICPPNTIFGSNTSVIPITKLAEVTRRPSKCLGTHFFNPVPLMKLVEIIKGVRTSEETIEIATHLCRSLDKETIRVNRDIPGFVFNRINTPSTIEAIKLVEAGVASIEDIDKGMRLGFGRPWGPFETSDLAGLDLSFNASSFIYKETQDEKFRPPPLLEKKIKMGHLGRKTKIGWYKYDDDGNKIGVADEEN